MLSTFLTLPYLIFIPCFSYSLFSKSTIWSTAKFLAMIFLSLSRMYMTGVEKTL